MKKLLLLFIPFLLFGFAANFTVVESGTAKGLWNSLSYVAVTIGVFIVFHALYKLLIEDNPQEQGQMGSKILWLILGFFLVFNRALF